MLIHLVRDSSGFSEYDGEILGLTLSFYLTIMVHSPESNTYHGANMHRGEPSSGTPQPNDGHHPCERGYERSSALRPLQAWCNTGPATLSAENAGRPLDIEEPAPLAPQLVTTQPVPASAEAGLQVAGQVREIRRARHLSQRQLAEPHAGASHLHLENRERQGHPHTRLAGASCQRARSGSEPAGPRLAQPPRRRSGRDPRPIRSWPRLPSLLPHLDSLHRTLVYGSVRDMATGRRRTA